MYARTTITLPTDTLRRVKVDAALRNKSVSGYIADFLKTGVRPGTRHAAAALPFGKYRLGSTKEIDRKVIYESYLRRKIPS
jgi:hypothetical protein